ncbi:ABC transporter ATP-binding protein [Peptoniphilaceae bacterium SGI.131]
MAFLEISNLNVYYGNIHAIKNISFHVNEGEIVSIIGANGAGKTTTLQTISGLIKAKSGQISFNGIDISNYKADSIVKLGLAQVPEGRRIFANLSVAANMKLGSYSLKENPDVLKQMRKEYYDRFPVLRERKLQLAGTLSGGEQQMLAMGRALMSKPKLLILDEPSMGLSPLYVSMIFDLIVDLNKNHGTTILLVEQNASKALSISHRSYVLETGQISLEGRSQDLLKDPSVKKAYLGA